VPPEPVANKVAIDATGIQSAVLNVKRARVDCDAEIAISSDGPLSVELAGCDRTVTG